MAYDDEGMTETADGGVELEMEQEDAGLTYDDESPNLVRDFSGHPDGKKALKKIAQHVDDCFKSAHESSSEYRERVAQDWKLFAGEMPKKRFPFQDCANLNIPILMQNIIRLYSRMSTELFGDWTSVVGVVPVNSDDEAIAASMSKHDNWQMREDIPDFQRQSARLLLGFLVTGDVTMHSFYDFERKQNRHEALTPDDFVIPYTHVSTMPDYSDLPYYCRVLRLPRHAIQAKRLQWENVDEIIDRKPAWDEDEEGTPIRDGIAETQGESPPAGPDAHGAAYKLLQFEGWYGGLPDQVDDRFIQVIMDPHTLRIASLTIHEEVHWKDRAEDKRKQAELDAYWQQRTRAQQMNEEKRERDAKLITEALDRGATAEEQMGLAASANIVLPEPEPPSWVDNPQEPPVQAPRSRKSPIYMFGHGVNIEPILGGLGLGYGRIQSDFARAANTLLNQWVDAGTIANAPPMLTTLDLPADFGYSPGKTVKVDAIGEELAQAFFRWPSTPANPQLFEAAQFLVGASEQSAQAPDVLSGAPGKSGETFRGIASRIEQATKQLSSMGRIFATGVFKQTVLNNARLNSMFLPETQLVAITNPQIRQFEQVRIDRSMYERNYNVEIRADLRFTSEAQKEETAMQTMGMVMQNPYTSQNPAIVYQALVDIFEAQKRPDMIAKLGAPPPVPEQFGPPGPPPGAAPPGAPPGGPPPGAPPGPPPGPPQGV